ncbi:MAG: GAF domain-containing protein [Bacteroidales bacterium]|nr:GAF domain-containing protein [Bacteroidales bacterium]
MNLKSIHIQYKFLLQVFIFVVYLGILTGTILLMNGQLSEFQQTTTKVIRLERDITGLHSTYLSFLQSTGPNDRFFIDAENDFTLKFDYQSAAVLDSLNQLSEKPGIRKKLQKSGKKDSLQAAIENYSIDFDQTRLAMQERGARNSGKILALRNISTEAGNTIYTLNLPRVGELFSQLKKLESEYLFAGNYVAFNEILGILNDILSHPSLYEADPFLSSELNAQLTEYKTALEEIQALSQRLGDEAVEESLFGTMEQDYQKMMADYLAFKNSWNHEMNKARSAVLLIGLGFILLLSLGFLFISYLFFNQIRKPLLQSIQYSQNLAKGKLNLEPVTLEGAAEFVSLNSNLNTIHASLTEKKRFVDSLLKQKFQADIDLQGRNDTFGKTLIALKENMRKARDEQLKYHEENRIRRFQNEGIAKFSDIMRSNSDNLDKLADIFIKEIVRYLNAIQGGLFLLNNEDDEILHLKAAFAYNRKKYLSKEIRKGESLVGTCAQEKKTIYLTKLPDDYIEITSGLGDAPPNNLLILPVMHEGVLIGVLEIASLKPFDHNQIELGETISESLASSIINARANSRTSELLEKSQQQAAEMAEQEEEMRQNMEELKATQEESARREEDLEGIISAIGQAFYVVEYDIDGSIIKVNERLLYLLNQHADQVIGKTHIQVFGKKSRADSLLFANVAEGKTIEITETVQINKKQLEMKNTFSPIKSRDGHTMRILNIMNLNK